MTFQTLRGKALRIAITVSAGSAYLLFGYDQGVLGGLVTDPSFLSAIDNPSPSFLGLIVALYNIGCLAGCMVAAAVGNTLGRKRSIFWGCSIMIIGGIIQTATYGSTQLIIGRLISGVGNGKCINTSTVPIYVSECSPAKNRGRSVAIQLSIVIFGTVVAYWLDYGTIKNLTGEDRPENDDVVQTIVADMERALQLEEQGEAGRLTWKSVLNDKSPVKNTRRLVLCFMIQFWQQFTGINVIAFYVTIVLETNVGLSRDRSSLIAGCIQIAFWCGTFPPMVLLDRIGRRPMLLLGSMALFVSMVIFTAGIAVNTSTTSKMALAMLFVYEISFGMSWNSIPWLYAPEITPLKLRHIGSATATFSEWLWTFVIALITPYAIATAGWKFYILFCIMILLNMPFVYFFLPETSGKTLEEIDFIFVKASASDPEGRSRPLEQYLNSKRPVAENEVSRNHVENAAITASM
ncbi:Sugar transporter STL1 [Paramyrothecium foliicola]|nr:Sugar transporter STL1 [Paramyrothecium foliicola]